MSSARSKESYDYRDDVAGGNPLAVVSLAAENGEGFDSRARFDERVARFGVAKVHALTTAKHIAAGPHRRALARQAARLTECRRYLIGRWYYQVDRVRVLPTATCRQHFICPPCAIARGTKMMKSYTEKWAQVSSERPSLVLQMVTLTIRNQHDLVAALDHLSNALTEFFKRRHRPADSESKRFVGAFCTTEITKSEHGWHPHVHALVAVDPHNRVRPSALSAEWKEITGDSFIVDVHDVYGDAMEAFSEICKYALKFSSMSHADNVDAYIAIGARRRMVRSIGCFRDVDVPEYDGDELLGDHEPFVDCLLTFFESNGSYFHSGVLGSSKERAR